MTPASTMRNRSAAAPLRAERIQAERAKLLALRASNLHHLPAIMARLDAAFQRESGVGKHRWMAHKGEIQQDAADLGLMYDVVHALISDGYFLAIYDNAETVQVVSRTDGRMDPAPPAPEETHILMKGWRLWVSWHPNEPQYFRDGGRTPPQPTRCGVHTMNAISEGDRITLCEMMQLVGDLRKGISD